MPKLVVVIDARRARQGADEFIRQQERMTQAATRGARDNQQAQGATFDTIIQGLDREIARREAVQEALKLGTNEARIERKIQQTIESARAKGIALGDQEIAQLREKARVSQELANAQAEAYRSAANEEKDNTTEAKRKRMKETLSETRGWVGDINDAFEQVGQQLLGLSDNQTKAVETTLYMTEKGMALGEVFGPIGAVVGGVGGALVGLATAESKAASEAQKLVEQAQAMHREFIKTKAALNFQKELEVTYLGEEKLRQSLEELSQLNVSEITAKISELSKVRDGYFKRGQFLKSQNEIRDLVDDLQEDKGTALDKAAEALDRVIAKNKEAAEAETDDVKILKERWEAAEEEVKNAEKAAEDYKKKLVAAKAEEKKAIEDAMRAYTLSDKGVKASEALEAALGRAADKTRALVPMAAEIGTRHGEAVDKAREKQEKYNTALAKGPSLFKAWGDEIHKSLNDLTGGGFDNAINKVLDVFDPEKMKAAADKKKKAEEEAKRNAEAIRDILKTQKRNADEAEAIKKKYEEAGADAADLEAAVLSKIGGKKLSDAQKKQIREDTAREIQANKDLAASKKAVADAEAEKKRAEEKAAEGLRVKQEIVTATEDEIAEVRELAQALAVSNEEYDKQAFILPRLKKLRDAGGSDKEIEAEKARAEALFNELEGIKKVQKAREDAIAAVDEAQKQSLEKQKQMQSEWLSFATSTVDKFGSQLNEALWEGEQDWGAFFKSVGKDLTAMLIKMVLMAALKAALTGGASLATGAGNFALGSALLGMSAGVMHNGGTVGAGGGSSRMVDPALFSNAPRFHNGTPYVGLKHDERAVILQTGEQVKSRAQVAADGNGGARTVVVHYHLPNVGDSRGFARSVPQQAAMLKRLVGAE